MKTTVNYQKPGGGSEKLQKKIVSENKSIWKTSPEMKLVVAIHTLKKILTEKIQDEYINEALVAHLVEDSILYDPDGKRKEFAALLWKLKSMK